MKIAEFSVERPVFITMFCLIIVVLGGIALKYLPIDLFPDIEFPACSIITIYNDASPQEVEELITRPLERQISSVTGIEDIISNNSEGVSSIIVRFTWGTNIDEAISDIRDRIDRVLRMLPDDVDRPTLRRFDSTSMPIMRIGVSTTMDLTKAKKALEDQVQYRFERIEGVASANVTGGYDREIHILLDIDKAKLLNVQLTDILTKLRTANVTTPAGNQKSGTLEVRMRTLGTFNDLDEIRNLFLTIGPDGSAVCIRDVADVVDTHEEETRFVRINGEPGIYLEIYKQSGANTVGVAKEVRKEIEAINDDMSDKFKMVPVNDESEFIQQSINNVSDTAVVGGILAIIILFIFLCNVRCTMIIAISIPLSIIATFALIYFCGYTLNLMTLGGLALGIGMLVDNSIVVLENSVRLHETGLTREDAAKQGAGEVTAALISSTLTTVVVFLPLVFAKGMAGVMFKQLAIVVAFSLLCSLVSALTIVPTLCGKLLNRSGTSNKGIMGILTKIFFGFFDWLCDVYADTLNVVLHFKLITILGAIVLLALCCFIVPLVGTELMPKTDEGRLRISMEDAVGTGPEYINETVIQTEEIIKREVPGLIHWTSAAGASTWNASGGHKANYTLKLVPRSERTEGCEDIAVRLGKLLNQIPGTIFRVRSASSFMGGRSGDEGIEIDIRGYDFDTAEELAKRVREICMTVEGITDTRLSRDIGMPENRVIIDREKAGKMKVSVNTIADALRLVLAGTEANNYRENGYEYAILVKVKDAKIMDTSKLLDITVRNADGESVALRNFIKTESVLGPVTIERKNQQRNLTVSANLYDRDMGSAIEELQQKIKDELYPLPADFTIMFAGDYKEQMETYESLGQAFVLALFLVYMVMACQFESLIDPLIVMFSVPLAAIGVILTLFMTGTTFNIQSFIGCIMLAGIVVNNAILLVDTANLLRSRDKMPIDIAIRETGRRRLRPILMTTLTTVLGLVPLALGWGEGGESQAPMARAVIGGLTSSTLITLFFIPSLYAGWEGMCEKIRLYRARKKVTSTK